VSSLSAASSVTCTYLPIHFIHYYNFTLKFGSTYPATHPFIDA
jgi:hypothetical protein